MSKIEKSKKEQYKTDDGHAQQTISKRYKAQSNNNKKTLKKRKHITQLEL